MTEQFTPPAPEDREDGMEVLAFHRGRWRHVSWSTQHQGWLLGYGGALFRDADRPFAPLPEKPEGAPGFFDFQEPI